MKTQAQHYWETEKENLKKSLLKRNPSTVEADMHFMHSRFAIHEIMKKMDRSKALDFLKFRIDFLKEELDELYEAYENGDSEEIVDALVDLVVIAVGTADLFGVDFAKAWYEVLIKNLEKEPGVKPERPNPHGLPDLIKPEGWTAPSHSGNHGVLPQLFEKSDE